MAAPNYSWSQSELDTAKNFFAGKPTADAVYNTAQSLGLDQSQLADLYSKTMGGTYDQAYALGNEYTQGTGKQFGTATYQPQGILGATYVNGTPVLGAVNQYNPAASQTAASTTANTYKAPTTPNAQANATANYSATPTAQTTGTTTSTPTTSATQQSPYSIQPANKQYVPKFDWAQGELDAARTFFNAAKGNPDLIYQAAINNGLSAEEVADGYVRTIGGDYNDILNAINTYITQSGKPPLVNSTRPMATGANTGSNGTTGFNTRTNVAKANAVNWDVTPDQTVEGRLKGLLSENNPLVQIGQTKGLEAANQRGLLNSSMGAEAGALAHYQYAMPIAQADANTYASAARQNANENTNVNLANAGALNQRSTLETNFDNSLKTIELTSKKQLEQMDAANKNAIDLLGPQYAQQARQNYTTSLTAALQQYNSFVEKIQMSDIPPEAKTSQIQEAQASYQNTVNFMNAMYGQLPTWSKEWSLIPA